MTADFSPFCFWERDASLRRQTFHAYTWVLRPIRCVTHCHLFIQRGLISEIAVVLLPALRCNKKGFRCNTRGFGVYEVSHIPCVETAPSAQAKTETIPVMLAQHTSTYISIRHHTSLFCEWIMRPYILPPWGLKISKNCVWLESDDVWSRTATSAADVCWRMLTNADECCVESDDVWSLSYCYYETLKIPELYMIGKTLHTKTHTHTNTLSLSLSLSHTHTHTHRHSLCTQRGSEGFEGVFNNVMRWWIIFQTLLYCLASHYRGLVGKV